MKRLIVCCDGTWQSQNNKVPTNVLKIAQAVKQVDERNNITQVLYYDQGIGAVPNYEQKQSFSKSIVECLQKIGGGAFGWGIDEKIEEAYIFLCLNYEPGDEIYLFGFSRGAYTVRSLAGLISCCGLLKRPDINKTADAYEIYRNNDQDRRECKAREFRQNNNVHDEAVKIKFLGCWDTVGALGIPNLIPWLPIDKIFQEQYKFHDNKLSSIIENARHAIAIDEKRSAFEVAIMIPSENFKENKQQKQPLKQVWFPGDHGCIGGGTKETLGLSNAALKWMADEAYALGLDLDLSLAEDTDDINVQIPFKSNFGDTFLDSILKKRGRNIIELNKKIEDECDKYKFNLGDSFHDSVKKLWCNKKRKYRPNNLKKFIENNPHNWCK